MRQSAPPKQINASGPDDPEGRRTAAVLAAYFHAEHMKAFRLLLWRRLGVVATIWFLVGVTTNFLSNKALVVGLAAVGAFAAWAAIVEWRAAGRVNRSWSRIDEPREERSTRSDQRHGSPDRNRT